MEITLARGRGAVLNYILETPLRVREAILRIYEPDGREILSRRISPSPGPAGQITAVGRGSQEARFVVGELDVVEAPVG